MPGKPLTGILLAASLAALAACEEEGPAERAGERIDEAAEELESGFQDARDEVEQAVEDAREAAEDDQ